jgi:hypothetical protein
LKTAGREDLAGRSDRITFEVACSEGRALVTNNIKDFRPLAAEWLAQGRGASWPDSASVNADSDPQRDRCCSPPRSSTRFATTRTAERE